MFIFNETRTESTREVQNVQLHSWLQNKSERKMMNRDEKHIFCKEDSFHNTTFRATTTTASESDRGVEPFCHSNPYNQYATKQKYWPIGAKGLMISDRKW